MKNTHFGPMCHGWWRRRRNAATTLDALFKEYRGLSDAERMLPAGTWAVYGGSRKYAFTPGGLLAQSQPEEFPDGLRLRLAWPAHRPPHHGVWYAAEIHLLDRNGYTLPADSVLALASYTGLLQSEVHQYLGSSTLSRFREPSRTSPLIHRLLRDYEDLPTS